MPLKPARRITRATRILLVLMALLTTSGLVSAAPARAALVGTSVSGWSTTAVWTTVGKSVNSTLTIKAGTTASARPVTIQRKLTTATTWSTYATTKTSSTGVVQIVYPTSALSKWMYRVVVPATTTAGAAVTLPRTVTVSPSAWSWATELSPGMMVMDPDQRLNSVSCPSTTFCAATAGDGQTFMMRSGVWSQARPVNVGFGGVLTQVACASASLCLSVDSQGRTWALSGSSWVQKATVPGASYLGIPAVSCVRGGTCFAAFGAGTLSLYAYTSTGWVKKASVANPDPSGTPLLSCTTATFCGINAGMKLGIFNGTSISWQASGSGRMLSCVSTTFCLSSAAMVYRNGTWSSIAAMSSSVWWASLSCGSASYCTAVSDNGTASYFNGSSWTAEVVIDSYALGAVDCPALGYCVALDVERTIHTI